ncbi:LOW QUALITY PROTEIN: uncharacterized protein [Mobula birostris]|uniref:LOW QUALITY PROTEIN: uncharacterized protein n=1 Tax=Mobula birostris TaxID=1983395 RepID=UPI003B27FBED
MTLLSIGTWNVRTLLDNPTANGPERRTVFVARALARYNIDIAALSETRLADEGQLTETGGGYTLFWSGRGSDERRDAGVGFAVRSHLVRKLASLPKGVNDRLTTLQLPLQNRSQTTLISTYAPTMTNPDVMKGRFYEEPDALLSAVRGTDKLILLGDFNARGGRDSAAWQGVVGRHGVGNCNSNGLLLLKTCAAHGLLTTNTTFRLPTRNRTSWMHLSSKHWHLLDYVPPMLGLSTRKQHDLLDQNDEEIQALLVEEHRLHRAHQNDPPSAAKKIAFTCARRTVWNKPHKIQDAWLSAKADELRGYADGNDSKRFCEALNSFYGPQSLRRSPLLSIDGTTLITEKAQILQRWAEHFEAVLSRPSSINDEVIDRIPQVDINSAMDDSPAELKDVSIIHLYKRKGNRQVCDNHRGISLLSITGKTLARVLLNRLVTHLELGLLPESQCGFHNGRGMIDMIFATRQLQEKCQEQNRELYTTLADLTKAFDTVCRQGLWRIMTKFGCPAKFIQMVRQFHGGLMARVLDGGESSEAFPVTNGVKQGCVLAPTLFSMMFTAMLNDAFQDSDAGISLKYRADGKLFNLRRLQTIPKVKETVLRDVLFAGDCALYAGSEPEMQVNMDKFSTVKGQKLQAVDQFTYLGSTLSRAVTIDTEVNCRIAKASSAFGRLLSTVWGRRRISPATKLKVYRAVVLTTLLYACETWTVYRRHVTQLNHFHMACLRRILGIRWQDKVPDAEVLSRASLPSVHTRLMRAQTRWAGHVIRMPDERIPRQLLFGDLSAGRRSHGGHKKRCKDTLKASLKSLDVDTTTWETLAQNCPTWSDLIHKGCQNYEARRIAQAQYTNICKCELCKSRATGATTAVPTQSLGACVPVRKLSTAHLRKTARASGDGGMSQPGVSGDCFICLSEFSGFYVVNGVATGTGVGPSFPCLFVGYVEQYMFQAHTSDRSPTLPAPH